jgi:hypothetical protein
MPYPSGAEGTDGRLIGVSCGTASACMAVGTKSLDGTKTFAERWDGTDWWILPTPNPASALESQLDGVSCASATNCMAVGSSIYSGGEVKTLAQRWDGTSWSNVSAPNVSGMRTNALLGISCSSGTSCIAVGHYAPEISVFMREQKTLIESWDGSAWTIQSSPNPQRFNMLTGIACSSSTACTAVGHSRPDIFGQTSRATLAERYG